MTTRTDELERTLASDPVLSDEQHAAEVYLARALAAELDAQASRGELQTRTVASYAGVLGASSATSASGVAARPPSPRSPRPASPSPPRGVPHHRGQGGS